VKIELAKQIPIDKRHKHYIRYGQWKCVINADDTVMLFDQFGPGGISEQKDVAADNQQVIAEIQAYFKKNSVKDRYVTIPTTEVEVPYWSK
jgi:hypothetical protein